MCRLLLHKNAGNEYGLEFNVAPHAFSLLVVYSEAEEVFCAPDSWGAMFECICTISFGCLLLIIYHDWLAAWPEKEHMMGVCYQDRTIIHHFFGTSST